MKECVMAYSIETYLALKEPEILRQRFLNCRPIIASNIRERDLIKKVMDDPEYAKKAYEEAIYKVEDIKLQMNNIIVALKILEAMDDVPEEEENDDDE